MTSLPCGVFPRRFSLSPEDELQDDLLLVSPLKVFILQKVPSAPPPPNIISTLRPASDFSPQDPILSCRRFRG